MEPKGETDDMGALSPHHMDCVRAPLPSCHYHQARPSIVGQLGVSWTGLGLLGHEDVVPAQREGRGQPGGGQECKVRKRQFPLYLRTQEAQAGRSLHVPGQPELDTKQQTKTQVLSFFPTFAPYQGPLHPSPSRIGLCCWQIWQQLWPGQPW